MRRLRALIWIAVVALVSSACSSGSTTADASYRVTIVNCAGSPLGIASAVAIGPTMVATVAHPFVEFESLVLVRASGEELGGTLRYLDLEKDVALIELDAPISGHLPLAPPVADTAVEIGTFTDNTFDPTRGTILRTLTIRLDGEGDRAGMELEAEIEAGDSGAGVIIDGEIVGVVFASSNIASRRAWAISSSEILRAQERVADGTTPTPGPTC